MIVKCPECGAQATVGNRNSHGVAARWLSSQRVVRSTSPPCRKLTAAASIGSSDSPNRSDVSAGRRLLVNLHRSHSREIHASPSRSRARNQLSHHGCVKL